MVRVLTFNFDFLPDDRMNKLVPSLLRLAEPSPGFNFGQPVLKYWGFLRTMLTHDFPGNITSIIEQTPMYNSHQTFFHDQSIFID